MVIPFPDAHTLIPAGLLHRKELCSTLHSGFGVRVMISRCHEKGTNNKNIKMEIELRRLEKTTAFENVTVGGAAQAEIAPS
jgi:hypothetical protein